MRALDWCMTGLAFALVAYSGYLIPHAIDSEMAFHENIRKARCERAYIPGYCQDVLLQP